MSFKPIGRKAYGSIPHLPGSRLGPRDQGIGFGQARICTQQARDRYDKIIVQEKLDGSCVAVARLEENALYPLVRSGWVARSSRFKQHHLFCDWVAENYYRFLDVLQEGERLVGEWLAQAHGTKYYLGCREPFFAFDIMREDKRIPYDEFVCRIAGKFQKTHLLHYGGPLAVYDALKIHEQYKVPCDKIEGVVYRVERYGLPDFLAKYVKHDKVDGCYLQEEVWNWHP